MLWNGLILLCSPLLLLYKLWRFWASGKAYELEAGRWSGDTPTPERSEEWAKSPGKRIVFAGVSFGEAGMIDAVEQGLRADLPDAQIAYCLRDPATRRTYAAKEGGPMLVPWPYEFIVPIVRWLERYRPDCIVLTQSNRQRTLAVAAKLCGVKVAMFGANFRPREGAFYKLAGPYYRWLYGAFDCVLVLDADSERHAKKWVRADARVQVTGDVKFDKEVPGLGEAPREELERWLRSDLPLVAAGSTESDAEDRMVLDAFLKLREHGKARLLVAPRKVGRAADLAGMAAQSGLSISRRTDAREDADVLILDTLGELAYAYGFARAAYVGGAFDGQGHNVLEPLVWGVPVCYGMRRGHFAQMQIACEAKGISKRVATAEDLAEFWLAAIRDTVCAEETRRKTQEILIAERGTVERTAKALAALVGEREGGESVSR